MDSIISVARGPEDVFVHIPPRLDWPYLESVLARALGRPVALAEGTATNLCSGLLRVSNSGATVLKLSMRLEGGDTHEWVAKILSPDPWNVFKFDVRFSSRLREVAWAKWWGQQNVSWVPRIYDTRADPAQREFWIIHEYFPQVGWREFTAEGAKEFPQDDGCSLQALLRQVALLHAHSRRKIDELRVLFPSQDPLSGNTCSSRVLRQWLQQATADAAFLTGIGVSDPERATLARLIESLEHVPEWVERWDEVCITSDWAPDNFGVRRDRPDELVTFDWGTTHLAPLEEDLNIVLRRLNGIDAEGQRRLLADYLDAYGEASGRRMDVESLLARLPWAWYFSHLRMIVAHIENLRWIPHENRSIGMIHLFIGLCDRLSQELWRE